MYSHYSIDMSFSEFIALYYGPVHTVLSKYRYQVKNMIKLMLIDLGQLYFNITSQVTHRRIKTEYKKPLTRTLVNLEHSSSFDSILQVKRFNMFN